MRSLARRLRFVEKKRGDRRTGSDKLGSVGLTLFFVCLFFAGWCFLIVVFTTAWSQWQANRRFVETTCTVLGKRIDVREGFGESSYRPAVQVRYAVDGISYVKWTYDITGAYGFDREPSDEALRRFEIGQKCPCWYDPRNPGSVVVERSYDRFVWMVGLLPLALICVGISGILYNTLRIGASTERRLAIARAASAMKAGRLHPAEEFPCIPQDRKYTDSPGTALAYRLPIAGPGRWALAAVLAGCLLWNALACVFLTITLWQFLDGQLEWLLAGLSTIFAAVGVFLFRAAFARLRRFFSVGRTVVEISDHPLYPGEGYRVFMAQFGRMRIRHLRLALECVESVTYQQGTNTRSEQRKVFEQALVARGELTIDPSEPFEEECEFTVPEWAMHSFRAPSNQITWQLTVEGSAAGWSDFQRCFPVVVFTPREGVA